jgi:integrase/recombinase XerD
MADIAIYQLGFDTTILAGRVSKSSKEMYERDFKAYLSFAGSKDEALKASTLARWITCLANDTNMSPNTINRMVSAVKKIMKIAADQNYILHEVAESFKHVDGVKVIAMKDRLKISNRIRIEPDAMRMLIKSIDSSTLVGMRNVALFTTLASSGLRIKELVKLKPEQIIKCKDGYLLHMYAEMGKNQDKDRDAHISVEAVEAIKQWLAARPIQSEYIFTSFKGKGNRPLAKPITPQGAWKVVKEITEAQGLQNIKPHDFRRFVGTQLAKKDIHSAQLALGHKRIETTAKYDLREIEVGATDHLF